MHEQAKNFSLKDYLIPFFDNINYKISYFHKQISKDKLQAATNHVGEGKGQGWR